VRRPLFLPLSFSSFGFCLQIVGVKPCPTLRRITHLAAPSSSLWRNGLTQSIKIFEEIVPFFPQPHYCPFGISSWGPNFFFFSSKRCDCEQSGYACIPPSSPYRPPPYPFFPGILRAHREPRLVLSFFLTFPPPPPPDSELSLLPIVDPRPSPPSPAGHLFSGPPRF